MLPQRPYPGCVMEGLRRIEKIEVSDLFWKNLAKWRKIPEYWAVRKSISDMVKKASQGLPPGDRGFHASRWKGVSHMHLPAKLIVFTMYPNNDTLRLCALAKHDFYGFKNERKSLADNAARKVLQAADRAPMRRPDGSTLKWRDPAELIGHPEIAELSLPALQSLYQEVREESETFDIFHRTSCEMSQKMQDRFSETWVLSLIEAEAELEKELIARARKQLDFLKPVEMEVWSRPAP